jgi:hypothetical protein
MTVTVREREPVSSAASLAAVYRYLWDGQIPSRAELADILEAYADKPLPPRLADLIAKQRRGELKRKRGRRRQSEWRRIFLSLACWDYRRHLAWLQRRERTCGLKGWTAVRDKPWWQGPPHERALAIVLELYRRYPEFRMIGHRRFRNLISSPH